MTGETVSSDGFLWCRISTNFGAGNAGWQWRVGRGDSCRWGLAGRHYGRVKNACRGTNQNAMDSPGHVSSCPGIAHYVHKYHRQTSACHFYDMLHF